MMTAHCGSIGVAAISKLDIDCRFAERKGFAPSVGIDNTQLIDFRYCLRLSHRSPLKVMTQKGHNLTVIRACRTGALQAAGPEPSS
jgi:hypothetical protein